MLNIPWTAYRTNLSILRELNVLTDQIIHHISTQGTWVGTLATLPERGVIWKNLWSQERSKGKRPRGRSPTCLSDQICTTLGSTVYDAVHTAVDRHQWRSIIRHKVHNEEVTTPSNWDMDARRRGDIFARNEIGNHLFSRKWYGVLVTHNKIKSMYQPR